MTKAQWRKVSLTPWRTPPIFPTSALAMLVPAIAMSIISGIANRPSVAGTNPIPSQRNGAPTVYLSMPEVGSRPTKASKSPRHAATSPFVTDRPVREARNAMPSMENMKYWGEPTDKTRGLTIGIEIARHNAPKIAPTNELIRAAPRARPASPFFAMGWPLSTPEQNCIGLPDQKYISDAGKKGPRPGGLFLRHHAWFGLSAGMSELARRELRLL